MKQIIFFLGVFLVFFIPQIKAQKPLAPVTIDADSVNYLHQEKKISAVGNVVMKYQDIVVNCNKATYYNEKNIAHLEGEVRITSPRGVILGEDLVYDFTKKEVKGKNFRVSSPPVYGSAQKAEGNESKYILHNGWITTCDLKKPHYSIWSKKILVYPQEKVVAKNVFFKIGKVPIFYLPYYSQSLRDRSAPFELSGGKSEEWGMYLLSRWRYRFNEENKGKLYLDWYEKRGEGIGGYYKGKSEIFGESLFDLYYIQDKLCSLEKRTELFDIYPERSTLSSKSLEDDRYRLKIFYSKEFAPSLSLKAQFYKFSDENFSKDFFYREYEREPHPLSYLLLDWAGVNSSLSLLLQKRVNRFFTETEYLPKIEYNFFNQKIVTNYPLYFKSTASLAVLNKKNAFSSTDGDAGRFYTHNVFSYSTYFDWLRVNPWLGYYAIYYTKNTFGDENILRGALDGGITLSTQVYKIFESGISVFGEDVEKFKHIITPTLTYSYIHSPTVANSVIFQFDELDDLARKDSLVFKLENKLQAKNKNRKWDFLYFSPSLEYKLNQEGRGSYFDNIRAELEIYPSPSLSLEADSFYDCKDRAFRDANVDLNFHDAQKKYSFSFGQRYARKESSQSTLSLSSQLTRKLQFKSYLRYEHKKGEFKEQQYMIRRDLHCWWMDLGLDVDDKSNFTFWIIFRLKAFPQIHLGFDHTYHGAKESY